MTTFCLLLKHLVINRPCVPYPNYRQLFVSVSVKYFVVFFFNVLTCVLTHSVLFGFLYWRMSKTFFLGNMRVRRAGGEGGGGGWVPNLLAFLRSAHVSFCVPHTDVLVTLIKFPYHSCVDAKKLCLYLRYNDRFLV